MFSCNLFIVLAAEPRPGHFFCGRHNFFYVCLMVSTCNAMSCHVNVIHSHALPFLGKMSGGSADCENDNEDEWYPGKMIGLERQEGEWYPGKMLGRKKNRRAENELIYQEYPLAWKNIDQLTVELSM